MPFHAKKRLLSAVLATAGTAALGLGTAAPAQAVSDPLNYVALGDSYSAGSGVLPLDPHGPLRELFERIRTSGLRFGPVRFAFTPHATLSYFPTLDRRRERQLLAERVPEPAIIDRLELSLTNDPQPPKKLFELPLEG